jgi:hypothetical protein
MKDQRLKVFRSAIDGLLESLEAFVRVSRWTEPGSPPEPLSVAAAKLVDRLGVADRLSSGKFLGTPSDSNKVTAMCTAMRRLDAAYVAYRQRTERSSEGADTAAATLEAEIGEVRTRTHDWS